MGSLFQHSIIISWQSTWKNVTNPAHGKWLWVYNPTSSEWRFFSWSHPPPNPFTLRLIRQCLQSHPTTLLQSVYHYHGQTSYFSSCRHSGYGLGTGFLQRVSKVKALSVAITLQLTNLYYQRCSELDVNNQVPHHYFRFGHPCASAFDHSNFQSHDFVDEEDLFVRDLDAFDDLEARELLQIMEAESVFFLSIYNKCPLNAAH